MPFTRFGLVLRSFLQHRGLPFAQALPEETIQQAFDDEGVSFGQGEGDVYTPPLTLWAFLSQVLFKDEQRSCAAAVARVIVLLVALGKRPCSDDSGAYCRARAKLPVPIIRRLAVQVAEGCEQQVPQEWLWKGRHVHLVDGSTISMPDTAANQAEYPQPTTQEPGLGFPIARVVVLLSLATAMIKDLAIGPYAGKETGETALLRELLERFKRGDILLADRYFCSYFMMALLLERGVDFVTRLHQARTADFRRGRRLGPGDHLVEWQRPAKPEWMDQETYDRMPASIRVREVEVQVHQPGFRVESFVVVTTLTDADQYSRDDLAELYRQRWLAELDIRTIKCTLGLDVLRCKSPEMIRCELWTGLLAYNLIRQTMLQAALQAGRSPRQLSFAAALQKIAASWNTILVCQDATVLLLIEIHLGDMATHRVGDRPDRVEPRAIKRRPKPQRLLMQPRRQARAALLAGADE
jgi:putative transposase